jgi:hypothetical protein
MGRVVQVALAGLLLAANAGCLVVAGAAAAAGGAAAGYAYFAAPVYQEFPLAVPDAAAATRAALADLQLPLVHEEQTPEGLKIESMTGEQKKILIVLTARPQKLPSDGVVTRISIRVAILGDDLVSGRILDQIHIHLPGLPGVAAPVDPDAPLSPRVGRVILPEGPTRMGPSSVVRIQPVAAESAEPPPAAPIPVTGPPSAVPQPIR